MIIVKLPEGSLVPNVSSPPNSNPPWNEHKPKDIEELFEFAIFEKWIMFLLDFFKNEGRCENIYYIIWFHWQKIGGQLMSWLCVPLQLNH